MYEKNGIRKKEGHKKPLWRKWLKGVLIGFSTLLVLCGIVISVVLYMLTPEDLTPMFEKYASDYVDADVKIQKVKLKFWGSFPRLTLEIDGLQVRSRTLDGLPQEVRDCFPANADSLLSVESLRGGVNFWSLTKKKLRLYDVEIVRPNLFIAKGPGDANNYDIFKTQREDSTFTIPEIRIDNFVVKGEAPIRYFSSSDSTDMVLTLSSTDLKGSDAPRYLFDLEGVVGGKIVRGSEMPEIPIGIDGTVTWNQSEPGKVGIENMKVIVDGIALDVKTNVEIDSTTVFRNVVITGKDINLGKALNLVPESLRNELEGLTTDITADVDIEALDDYVLESNKIPSMNVNLVISGGSLWYDRLTVSDIQARVHAFYNGSDPAASVVDVKRLDAKGPTLDFTLTGVITSPFSNPCFAGHFNGHLDFNSLPRGITAKLPFTLSGDMSGETKFKFREDNLNRHGFHKINADGTLALRNFRFGMRDSTARLYTEFAQFDFGTSSSYEMGGEKVDSMLRVTLTADSVAFMGEGVRMVSNGLRVSAGTKNTVSSLDTTEINPIGIVVSANKLRVHSLSDTMNMYLRDAKLNGQLKRYKDEAKRPLLTVNVSTGSLRYSDPVSRIALSDAKVDMDVHPRTRRSISSRPSKMSSDAMKRAGNAGDDETGHKNLDFNLDRTLMSWLRNWEASGTVKAVNGNLMTPYFPVKNELRNVDVTFSTDSVIVKNLEYRMGKSDFNIKGKVSNIVNALTSTSGAPLEIDLNLNCDTLDLNNITSAILAGSAYADKMIKGEVTPITTHIVNDSDGDDAALQNKIDKHMNDSAPGPFLVPWNIDAKLDLYANSLLYADIWFQKMTSNIAVKDGAIHIDRLAGYTPIGSMDISALYAAPDRENIRFAAGAVVRELHLHQFLHLLPEIESILPLLKEVNGVVTADVAMTTDLDSLMNMKFHTFNLVMKLQGRDLTLVDTKDFMKVAKLLRLEHDGEITIDSMQVEMMVKDSHLDLFPFVFDFNRYKFGVSGGNDLNGDIDYHIAVLKSPIPFAFGVHIHGKPGHLHFGLGRANFDADRIASSRLETDTARINIVEKLESVFKFGVKNGHYVKLMEEAPKVNAAEFLVADTLTHADSLIFMQAGVFEGHDIPPFPMTGDELTAAQLKEEKKLEKEKRKEERIMRRKEEKERKRREKELREEERRH